MYKSMSFKSKMLKRVVASVNENKRYTVLIPVFIECWKRCYPDFLITICYIGEEIPSFLQKYEQYIYLFKPIKDVNTVFMSQTLRLLYPCLCNDDEIVMITDIDDVPANNIYYKQIDTFDADTFVSMRPKQGTDQIAITYNFTKSTKWREIFNIYNINDIISFYETYSSVKHDGLHGGVGWYTDQKLLYEKVMIWKNKNNNVLFLEDKNTGFKRMSGFRFRYDKDLFVQIFNKNEYSDIHIYSHECRWNKEDISYIIERLITLRNTN